MTALQPAPAAVPHATAREAGRVPITIAVPTFRRPHDLRAGLPMLLAHARELTADPAGRYRVEVLVVDNDPARSAEPLVAELAADPPTADPSTADSPGVVLRYASEPTPGIAAVRNRALDEAATSRLVAFIDDDERPEPGWLASLVDTWESTGAAVVSGRILADYAGELDPWIRAGGFFVRRSLPTGTPIDVAAAGNLFLDLAQIQRLGIRFASPLGLGAGEDTVFSRAVAHAGGAMVWCNESAAVDFVPLERMTRRWVLTRAWSHGNATVLVDLWLTPHRWARAGIRARGVGKGLLRIGGGAARWAGGILGRSHRHQARGLRAVLRGAGMIAGAFGVVFEEYARDGRRLHRARVRAA